ncbi:MAG: hypothetical protein Ctma_0772 [Catillopecten margaritatus gill symbiont]|uniref:Antitoxin n=1 Tax=Catillopecten margaritatus gill symbiont TaxID=3083288 RepID=A0AAU6PGC0_9GAMM
MLNISSAKAKNEFSNVLKQVQNGESFVVEYGRKHKKIAKIIPYEKPKKTNEGIKIGLYENDKNVSIKIHDDWAMTDEELLGLE